MSENPVVHFEMPYDDAARVSKFYGEIFGWGMQSLGEEMGNYVLAITTQTGEDQRPVNPGVINGGFAPRSETATAPSVVINVGDIAATADKIAAAGGELLSDVQDIPGIGKYIIFRDTEGNVNSLLQP